MLRCHKKPVLPPVADFNMATTEERLLPAYVQILYWKDGIRDDDEATQLSDCNKHNSGTRRCIEHVRKEGPLESVVLSPGCHG